MGHWFRSSDHDRQALEATVRALHETTVAGIAAALSWRPRKVERLLVDELTRAGTSMAYDPARRVVRWAPPVAVVWSDPPSAVGAPEPAPRRAPVDLGPTLAAPPPTVTSGTLRAQCPSCHAGLVASSSPSLNVCPACGRLFSSRTAGAGASAASPAPEVGPAPARPEPVPSPSYGDRRSQELLAAYVTASPIPCPRCHTRLQHRGVSEYGCPSCGEVVRFGPTGVSSSSASRSSAAAAPAPAR
ncbi:MAG TPA: hypothetical protein VMH49_05280 [Thermoplasmata archaeon]|nr:hypothetical protein [Thermoplasmata archaeon]